jgi:coenzyme F420-reducing hydrogenase beta subunit
VEEHKIICDLSNCTGCYACANVCPKQCISLEPDNYGITYPIVDMDKCINCNLCIKTCPVNNEIEYKYPIECYASWDSNKARRLKTASGGIGTALGRVVLQHGGVYFGSRYDYNVQPIISYTEDIDDLKYFQGSRYVQSQVGRDILTKVRDFLCQDRAVVFVGTPCQISGLKHFLKRDFEKLVTVDLICHGVTPTKYFNDEVAYLSKKYKIHNYDDVRFRGNDGYNFQLTIWNGGNLLYPKENFWTRLTHYFDFQDYYIKGFLNGLTLRENCYHCKYAKPSRISDITIGDFIGLGSKEKFEYPTFNVSSVTLNTKKGVDFFQEILEDPSYISIKRHYSERLGYKPSLLEPSLKHHNYDSFRKLYLLYGFSKALRLCFRKETFNRVKAFYIDRVKRMLFRLK